MSPRHSARILCQGFLLWYGVSTLPADKGEAHEHVDLNIVEYLVDILSTDQMSLGQLEHDAANARPTCVRGEMHLPTMVDPKNRVVRNGGADAV